MLYLTAMQFSEEDKKRLFDFYNPAIEVYGSHDARALRWSAEEQQLARFQSLSQTGDLTGSSVLDVACGFGDLYEFLAERFEGIAYLGIDINPKMIAVAHDKYPSVLFELADFGAWEGEVRDFVFASGAFSFKIPNHRDIYFGYIKKMFDHARKATAFNMLDARHHVDDATWAAYFPEEVADFCKTFCPNVKLYTHLPNDFTVYMYR